MFKIIKQLSNAKGALNQVDASDILMEVDDGTRRTLQTTILEMYIDVLRVCRKHKIVPYLLAGSALGAVRHSGFIPWDDDLDIGMTRAAYNKFTQYFEKELSAKYILCAPNYKDAKAKARFPKILKKGSKLREVLDSKNEELQSVFLDIFIIENAPENVLVRALKGNLCNALEFISSQVFLYENKDDIVEKFYSRVSKANYRVRLAIGKMFSFLPAWKWFDFVDSVAQYRKNSKLCTIATGREHYFGEILSKERLFPYQMTQFESIKAPIFKDIDYYLENLYGDYMHVPEPDKRERHFLRELEL